MNDPLTCERCGCECKSSIILVRPDLVESRMVFLCAKCREELDKWLEPEVAE